MTEGKNPIFFGRTQRINYQNLLNFKEKLHEELIERIRINQKLKLQRENLRKNEPKIYEVGEPIYTAIKQIQGKTKTKFRKKSRRKRQQSYSDDSFWEKNT